MQDIVGFILTASAIKNYSDSKKKPKRHIGKMGYAVITLVILNIALFSAMCYQVYR